MENYSYFNKETLIDIINNFVSNEMELEINVVFVNSKFDRKQKYKVYTLLTEEKDILPTVNCSLEYLKGEFSERSFEKYDLELAIDETVQIVEKDKVINDIELLLKMNEAIIDPRCALNSDVSLDSLNFIIMQLYDVSNNKSICFFQKYVHPTSKYSKALKYTLHGKKAELFKKDILTINPIVDAVLLDNNYYILNRKNFNSIFNFKDVFFKIINDNKVIVEQSELFNDTDSFIKDCMEDGRYLPRLTKVILAKGFESVQKNKSKLPELKSQYQLSFDLTKDNKITYNNKKQISDIINILLDHFVISALTDKKMLAKAIEKYEI